MIEDTDTISGVSTSRGVDLANLEETSQVHVQTNLTLWEYICLLRGLEVAEEMTDEGNPLETNVIPVIQRLVVNSSRTVG